MKKTYRPEIIVVVLCLALAIGLYLASIAIGEFITPEVTHYCDDACNAIHNYIEFSMDVPSHVFFPLYMSRFDLLVINPDQYQNQLPVNTCLGEKAVLITDSITGYKWLTNGYGTWYNIM
jgi:hypothetical protein